MASTRTQDGRPDGRLSRVKNAAKDRQNSDRAESRVATIWKLSLVLLIPAFAVAIASNYWATRRYQQAERELSVAVETLLSSRDRTTAMHNELDGFFGEVIAELEQQQIPLDGSARIFLRAGQGICERIANETDDPMRRASAYCTLGHVQYHRHELLAAVEAYRHAVQAATAILDIRASRMQAYAANYLATTLAQLGREEEAMQVCLNTDQSILATMNSSDAMSSELADELAFVKRNQAVLLASAGDLLQAVQVAQDHVMLLEQLVASNATAVSLVERLIDAKYMLAGLLWNMQDRSDANTYRARSQELLQQVADATSTLRVQAEQRMRRREAVDYGKYKAAAERAHRELALASDPESVRANRSPAFWTRKNLFRGRRSIGTEILMNDVRMPAEFEAQDAMLLNWSGREWMDASNVLLIKELATQLQVFVVVDDVEDEEEARGLLEQGAVSLENVHFFQVPSNSVWVRDFGPFTVLGSDGFPIWIDYHGPFSEVRGQNDLFVERLGQLTGHRVVRGPLRLEGGNLVQNGTGLFVCTRKLEQDNLKLGYTPEQFRKRLKSMVGCQQFVVLDNLQGEPTGHVDWFLTFVSADTVVVGSYDSSTDPQNAAVLDANAQLLSQVHLDDRGKRLQVVRIPMPPHPADRFGGSYTNVVFANGKLLVPQWENADAAMNARAVDVYQRLLPGWNVVPLDCTAMLPNSGAIHCATANIAKLPLQLRNLRK